MPSLLPNLLLETFPVPVRNGLRSYLRPVPLPVGTVLYEAETRPRYVHFLTSGMASVMTELSNGDAAEAGIVLREGMPEALHLLGSLPGFTRCFMQIAGSGLRMNFRAFEQYFLHYDTVRAPILCYAQYQSQILAQLVACNRFHQVEARLARWLLMVQDRIGDSDLFLTQELLANMVGARRSTVTLMLGAQQRRGFIRQRRGQIQILDRRGLEHSACECYRVTQKLFHSLYR